MSGKDTLNNHKKICVNCLGRNWLIQCKCGYCDELIFMIGREKNKPRKYKYKHHAKGKNNSHWKGGVIWVYDNDGNKTYLLIHKPYHHFADKHGYIRLHRHIYEYYHNCCLLPHVDIHHINGKKTDNHKNNLMVISKSDHMSLTGKNRKYKRKDYSNTICLICKSDRTYFNKERNYYNWYEYSNGLICNKCYNKLRYRNKKLLNIF